MQDLAGAAGVTLPEEDFKALSSFEPQIRLFEGGGFGYTEDGPWRSYAALWWARLALACMLAWS